MAKKINSRDEKINNKAAEAKYALSDESIAASVSDTKEAKALHELQKLTELLANQNNASGLLQVAEHEGYAQYDYNQKIEQQRAEITPKINNQFAKTIDIHSSQYAINKRTSSISSQQHVYKDAISHKDRYIPTETLLNQQESLVKEASIKGRIIAAKARGGGDPEELAKEYDEVSRLEDKISLNKGVLRQQNNQGLSTEKIYGRSSSLLERHENFFGDRQITEDARSGKYGSKKEEETKWNQAANNVKSAQAMLNDADAKNDGTEKAIENLANFNKALIDANDALKKQEDVVKAVTDRDKRKNDNFVGGASAVQSVFNSVMKVAVADDTQQTNNRTAWANTGNSMWDRGQDAVKNLNIESLMSVMDQSGRVGKEVAGTKFNANLAGGIGRAAGVGVAGAQVAGGVLNWAGNTGQQAAVAGVALGNAAELGSDQFRGLTTSSMALNEYNAQMAAGEAGRHMVASQAQEYVNHTAGSYYATRGSGSTSDMERTIMSMSNAKKYATVGVNLSEARSAAGIMSKAGYSKGGELDNIIMGAGKAELAGSMSKQEYATAAARLTGAGGDSKDLEAIMKAAVTAGMDNSKNVGQMVEATLSLSSSMASSGISGVDTAKSMVGERVEDLVSKGYDRNMATGKAMANIEAFDKGQTDRTVSFGNIIEQNKLRQLKGGENLSQKQMNNIVDMKEIDMAAIMKGGPEGKKIAEQMGLGDFFSNKGNAGQVNKIKTEKYLLQQTGGMEQSASMMAKLEAQARGESVHFTDKEMAVTWNSQSRTQTIDELNLTAGGKGGKPANNAPKTTSDFGGTKKAQDEREAKNAAVGAVAMDKMGGLTTAIQAMNKLVDPENFGKNIVKAANDFVPAAADIKKATGDLLKSVQAIQAMNTTMVNAMGKNLVYKPSDNIPNTNKNVEEHKKSMSKTGYGTP